MSLEKAGKALLKYPNVTGFSKKLRLRVKDRKVVQGEWCLQVHVSKKLKLKQLRVQDVIPRETEGFKTDIVEYGELVIPPLLKPGPAETHAKSTGKTGVIRPLQAGVSIGNYAITAGTLGDFMVKTTNPDKDVVFMGSNSHVLVDEPSNPTSAEKAIIQPGRYDGGSLRLKVGSYYWHKQIKTSQSDCLLSRGVVSLLNMLAKSLHRQSRFFTYVQGVNNIDFAVASIEVPIKPSHFDKWFDPTKYRSLGFGFAGSDIVSVACKDKYIKAEGYVHAWHASVEAEIGKQVEKSGRSCYKEGTVIDDSAYERVSFGSYYADFDDVFLTTKLLEPGDSGSALYAKVRS